MYIYIIREREFRRMKEPVWKPGRTEHETIQKRFGQYPNGSELIFAARVSDAVAAEKDLMQLLVAHRSLIHRKDIGREYFEGELDVVYGIASMVCARYIQAADWDDENEDDSNESDDTTMDVDDDIDVIVQEPEPEPESESEPEPEPLDSHLAVIKFVNDHRETLNWANMPVADVHKMFKGWLPHQSVLPNVSNMQSKTLSQSLCKLYKANYSTKRHMDGEIHPTLRFPALLDGSLDRVKYDSMDPVGVWLDTLEVDKDNVVSTSDAHNAFIMWQQRQAEERREVGGLELMAKHAFDVAMEAHNFKSRFPHKITDKRTGKRQSKRGYRGIRV
jgi:hypothetical protein